MILLCSKTIVILSSLSKSYRTFATGNYFIEPGLSKNPVAVIVENHRVFQVVSENSEMKNGRETYTGAKQFTDKQIEDLR